MQIETFWSKQKMFELLGNILYWYTIQIKEHKKNEKVKHRIKKTYQLAFLPEFHLFECLFSFQTCNSWISLKYNFFLILNSRVIYSHVLSFPSSLIKSLTKCMFFSGTFQWKTLLSIFIKLLNHKYWETIVESKEDSVDPVLQSCSRSL